MSSNLTVWHTLNPNFGMGGHQPFNKTNFKLVAIIPFEGSNPSSSRAFELTNHIDGLWWENEEVTLVGPPKQRSTSVGDVVVTSDGQAWQVQPVGYAKVSAEEPRTAKEIFADSRVLSSDHYVFTYDPSAQEEHTEDPGYLPDLVRIHTRADTTPQGVARSVGSFCIDNKGDLDCQTYDSKELAPNFRVALQEFRCQVAGGVK